MPDAVAAPVEAAKPAVPATLEEKFEAIKAAATAAAKPVESPAAPVVEDKKPAAPNAVDSKYITEIARLTQETRTQKAKLADFDKLQADALKFRELSELYGKDRTAAIGKLAGKDAIDEMATLMEEFYSRDSATPGEGEQMPAWAKALTAEIASLKETTTKEKTAAETKAAAERSASEKAGADKFIQSVAAKAAGDLEVSLRPENLAEATDNAHAAILAIAQRDGVDLAKADDATRDKVILEAWTEVENEFSRVAARLAKGSAAEKPAESAPFDPAKYTARISKPTPTFVTKPPATADLDDIIKHATQRFLAGKQ